MLRKILEFFSRGPQSVDDVLPYPDGKRYYRESHQLRRDLMDQDALKVINRLNRHGYRSYLVGGCVRDMILGRRPKDFDVVTTATPAQIRSVFSNSRAIGRRFKIVHIVFRGKIIEVSTFRSLPSHRLGRGNKKDADLMLHRDNQYGKPKEDAARRDFTVNALYFDPRNESVIDFVGGYEDIQSRRIRIIGDPDISFQEDPVRMLRAAKFAALLNFELDADCVKAIRKNKDEILKASPSRMLEEYNKIFRTGRTLDVFASLYETGLLKVLFPEAVTLNEQETKNDSFRDGSPMGRRLAVADKMLSEREDLTFDIYFGLLFADVVRNVFESNVPNNVIEYIKSRIDPICKRMELPGKDRDRLIQIYISQMRFAQTTRKKRFSPEFFRNKVFFYEAFMVFKINAIALGDEESMQRAMFWEIGPRPRPPENARAISMFGGHKRSHAPTEGERRPEHRDREHRGRRNRSRRGERTERHRERRGEGTEQSHSPEMATGAEQIENVQD